MPKPKSLVTFCLGPGVLRTSDSGERPVAGSGNMLDHQAIRAGPSADSNRSKQMMKCGAIHRELQCYTGRSTLWYKPFD